MENLKKEGAKENDDIANLKSSFKLKKYPLHHGNITAYITSRQLECLKLLSKGFSYKEIGNALQVTDRTVETHLKQIKDKLDIYSCNQMYHTQQNTKALNFATPFVTPSTIALSYLNVTS